MSKGKIMQVGTPLEIYRRPANTFVAVFVGNPPMNLLPCTVDANQKTIHFTEESATVRWPETSGHASLNFSHMRKSRSAFARNTSTSPPNPRIPRFPAHCMSSRIWAARCW